MKYTNNAVIWVNKDKNGKPYFSFKAERDIKEGEKFNFFKNDKGDNSARPDYKSYEKVEEEVNTEEEEQVADDVSEKIPF